MMYRPVLCLFGLISIAVGQITLSVDTFFNMDPPNTTDIRITVVVNPDGQPATFYSILNSDGSVNLGCAFGIDLSGLIFNIDPVAVQFITQSQCHVTGNRDTGVFEFKVAILGPVLTEPPLEVFTIMTGPPFTTQNQVLNNTVTINNFTEVTVPPTDYATRLEVVDENNNVQSTSSIGTYVKLQFTLITDPFIDDLTFAGALILSCYMDEVISMTGSRRIELVGSDSCVRQDGLFRGIPATEGFQKDTMRSTMDFICGYYFPKCRNNKGYKRQTVKPVLSDHAMRKHSEQKRQINGTKTFISVSPGFPVGGFAKEHPMGDNYVYFECSVRYCTNDTDTSQGTCGGPNCLPQSRRKREDSGFDDIVTASIKIIPDKQPEQEEQPEKEEQCTCPDPSLMYGSVGCLGVLAVTCFVVMLTTYVDVKRSARRLYSSSVSTMKPDLSPGSVASPRTESTTAGSLKI